MSLKDSMSSLPSTLRHKWRRDCTEMCVYYTIHCTFMISVTMYCTCTYTCTCMCIHCTFMINVTTCMCIHVHVHCTVHCTFMMDENVSLRASDVASFFRESLLRPSRKPITLSCFPINKCYVYTCTLFTCTCIYTHVYIVYMYMYMHIHSCWRSTYHHWNEVFLVDCVQQELSTVSKWSA